MDWRFGCLHIRLSAQSAVTFAGFVGLCAVGAATDGLLTAILVKCVGLSLVDLVLGLLLAALSSSSEEMSTTIWVDIMGRRFLARS